MLTRAGSSAGACRTRLAGFVLDALEQVLHERRPAQSLIVTALAVIGSTDLAVRPPSHLALAYRVMPVFCRILPYGWLTKAFAQQKGGEERDSGFRSAGQPEDRQR